MSAFNQFKKKVNLPEEFGSDQPYVRLAYVEEGAVSGSDADVELSSDPDRIFVTITEWQKSVTGTIRSPAVRYEFDGVTGKIISDNEDDLANLLISVDGMRVLSA